MNFNNYISTINRLWNNDDGVGVARFITLSGNHAKMSNLQLRNFDESTVSRTLVTPLDDIVINHIKVLFYLYSDRKLLNLRNCDFLLTKLNTFSSTIQ